MIEDPKTRHVYVVDKNKHIIGSIKLSDIREDMFPFSVFDTKVDITKQGLINYKKSLLACDIMSYNFEYVYEESKLPDVFRIMHEEGINELPVVNSQLEIIGEINFFEIILYYLKNK